MGYRDSDDSGFSRHGMNRDNDYHESQQQQRSHRSGYELPDLDRDEDLRTSHSVPLDSRQGRYEPPGAGRRDGQGYQGSRGWEGRDRYQAQGGRYRGQDAGYGYGSEYSAGYGYGARGPDIGGYEPYESEQRHRQQQYGGGYYGPAERARLNRPEGWAREGYGGYERDQPPLGGAGYGQRQGRSYGYGYDGRPDGGGYAPDERQDRFAGSHGDRQQGSQRHDPDYAAWRQEQLRVLDEDYDSWRNERYQKFSDEFNTWRSSRSRNQNHQLRSSNQSDQTIAQTGSASGKTAQGTAGGGTATSGSKGKE